MSDWPEQKKGDENPRSRISDAQVELMRERRALGGVTYRQLAEEAGVSHTAIRKRLLHDQS